MTVRRLGDTASKLRPDFGQADFFLLVGGDLFQAIRFIGMVGPFASRVGVRRMHFPSVPICAGSIRTLAGPVEWFDFAHKLGVLLAVANRPF